MMPTAEDHIKIFQNYASVPLTVHEKERALHDVMALPWVKRLLVFAEQGLILIDVYNGSYLYVSPSIKNICGYDPEEFTDFNFAASLMPPGELEKTIHISELFAKKLKELNFSTDQLLRLRSSRNSWLKRKDGRVIHTLQHGIVQALNSQGLPALQLLIITDITSFNHSDEHFYSLTLMGKDGEDETLLSGTLQSREKSITEREHEVLTLLARGFSSREIGERLKVSEETIKTHRKNLLLKSKSQTNIGLLRFGYAHGML